MDTDWMGRDQEPAPDHSQRRFAIHKAEVYVGEAGISGGSIDDLPPGRLVCAQCGYIEQNVLKPQVRSLQRQHEMSAHPDLFQKRRELQRALAELDRQLWGTLT